MRLQTLQIKIFDPIFNHLPFPIASALVRGIKAFITIVMAAIIASVADGSVFKDVSIVSPDQVPLLIAVLSPVLLAIDKWLREHGLENEQPDIPTSGDVGNGPPAGQ